MRTARAELVPHRDELLPPLGMLRGLSRGVIGSENDRFKRSRVYVQVGPLRVVLAAVDQERSS